MKAKHDTTISPYWDPDPILAIPAQYRTIFGERSNGKTFGVLLYGLQKHLTDGSELALIRRYDMDFSGPQSSKTAYDSLMCDGEGRNRISELTDGSYCAVVYQAGIYYLASKDDDGKIVRSDEIVARAFSISAEQHYKGSSFPNIKTVLFDEFIAKGGIYLADEFVSFQSLLSTIIRQRNDVEIFMCGNTLSRYNPYFSEMGLYKAKTMKPGDIDIYEYGSSGLRVAVQYADTPARKKKSDVYFAFENPKLKMITEGSWQLDIYPHLPVKYLPKEILFTYFIHFNDEMLQAEIVQHEDVCFTYIHRKTTDLKYPDDDLIYSEEYDPRLNHRRNLLKPTLKIEKEIVSFFRDDKVFYQDNEVGDLVEAYLQKCRSGLK